jgi:predicted site-specific integrase-resolvase
LSTGTVTRFGFGYLAVSLAAAGRRSVLLDEREITDDLEGEVTEVVTSVCARRSGRRSPSRGAARAVAAGRANDEEAGRVER